MKIGIFHVTATTKVGGSESYVWRLARFLTQRGHLCDLWAGAVENPIIGETGFPLRTAHFIPREKIVRLGGRFQKLGERLSFAWYARRALLGERYDVFNIHKPYDVPAALWFRRRTGCRIVWRCHGTDFYPGLGRLLPRLDAIYCVSEFARETLVRTFPVNAQVIYTGVDCAFFDPALEPAAPAAEPRILFYGRLEGWKGVRHLVDALAKLKSELWSAEIVGDGPQQAEIENQIRTAELQSRVRLKPAVKGRAAVRQLLAGADIVVFPSVADETFSNAVLEAMSMKRAVVATNIGGFPEAIENESIGLLVPPRDSDALAIAVRQLLGNAPLRERLGANARRRVTESFSADTSFRIVEDLFMRLTKPTPSNENRRAE